MVENIHMRIINEREGQIDVRLFLGRLSPNGMTGSAIHILMNIMTHDDLNAEVLLRPDVFFMARSFPGVIWIKSRAKSDLYKILGARGNQGRGKRPKAVPF